MRMTVEREIRVEGQFMVQCAVNACMAELLKTLYQVDEQSNILALD